MASLLEFISSGNLCMGKIEWVSWWERWEGSKMAVLR